MRPTPEKPPENSAYRRSQARRGYGRSRSRHDDRVDLPQVEGGAPSVKDVEENEKGMARRRVENEEEVITENPDATKPQRYSSRTCRMWKKYRQR